MHIFIDTYGVKIEVDNGMLHLYSEAEKRTISIKKIKSINCFKPVTLTSALMVLAAHHQVPILLYNNIGRVEAWVWSHKYGNIADLRVSQAFYSVSEQRMEWIKKILMLKIENQLVTLKWLKERKQKQANDIARAISEIENTKKTFQDLAAVATIRSYEALISKLYWEVVFTCMAAHTEAESRIKRGANDAFNCALNYLYGILYSMVESSLLMHGLDPYIGLLHINRHDKPALAFDHIEPCRAWADRMLMVLMMAGFDCDEHYSEEEGILRISIVGRKKLIETLFNFLEERSYLNGKRIKNKDHIHHLSNELVNVLKKYDRT